MGEPPTDELLVNAAAKGDTTAFDDLVQRHYPTLLRVCMQLTRDSALAQDCAEDACMIALTRLSQLRSGEAFGGWLVGVGRHTCHHALRTKVARQIERSSTAEDLELVDARTVAPLAQVATEDLSRLLNQAVEDLPAACRQAVNAFYFDGLGYAEASARLGISTSALKVRLHESRRILRHHYRLRDPPATDSRYPNARTLAIHEAAHAVLHTRAGGHVLRVSIEPVSAVWVAEATVGSPHRTLPAAIELQIRMAGEAATYVQTRRSARAGRSGDRDAAGALALEASGGDSVEAALLVGAAWRSARDALEQDRVWGRVQRVASRLLAVRSLDVDDLRRL
jgi:RNA polymerase sigma-70 factor (ECF subfamily)